MKTSRGVEIVAVAAIVLIVAALIGWIAWPSLTGVRDEPDSLRACILAAIWPVTEWVPETGQTLPSPNYLDHPPQYIPPTEPYPLPKELKAITDAQQAQEVPREEPDDR